MHHNKHSEQFITRRNKSIQEKYDEWEIPNIHQFIRFLLSQPIDDYQLNDEEQNDIFETCSNDSIIMNTALIIHNDAKSKQKKGKRIVYKRFYNICYDYLYPSESKQSESKQSEPEESEPEESEPKQSEFELECEILYLKCEIERHNILINELEDDLEQKELYNQQLEHMMERRMGYDNTDLLEQIMRMMQSYQMQMQQFNVAICNLQMQQSLMQQPLMQQPLMQQPLMQQPLMQQPLMQQPLMQQPLMQQPLMQQPLMQQPLMQQPLMQQPLMQQPLMQQPLMQQPLMQQPLMQQPLMQQPEEQQPEEEQSEEEQSEEQQPEEEQSEETKK